MGLFNRKNKQGSIRIERVPDSRRRSRSNRGFIFKLVVAAFVCFCIVSIVKLQVENNELLKKKEDIILSNQELEDENARLQREADAPKDEEYYEKKAREKFNFYLPQEIVFYNDLIKK